MTSANTSNKRMIGQLVYDDDMQPFAKDLQKQIEAKLNAIQERLGFTDDDLDGVPAGELSLAIIEHPDRPAVLAVTIDVTKHKQQADRLLAAIEKRFAARGGTKKDSDQSGTAFHVFTVPAADAKAAAQTTVYFIHDDVLCGINAQDEAEADAQATSPARRPTISNRSPPTKTRWTAAAKQPAI